MPCKRLAFMLTHRLRLGGRWRSPYHQLAYELGAPKHPSTVRLLLDYGFVTRASELLAQNPSLSTPFVQAKLAFLTGRPDLARTRLQEALEYAPAYSKELQRVIGLLTRLAPDSAASWARRNNRPRLARQIDAAAGRDIPFAPPDPCPPQGDEHLLMANASERPETKLAHLNAYFREMGLDSASLVDGQHPFSINSLLASAGARECERDARVSVVMTVYNGQAYVRSAALSVLLQRGVNVELIIVDDASTDRTWRIISELGREHPERVICRKLPRNVGAYKARNIALDLCSSDYVAFQDADDWSHPQRLARAVAWLERSPRRIAATCRYVRLDTEARFHSPAIWPLRQWSPNTLVFRRQPVIDTLGGFDEVRAGADTEYFERMRLHFGDARIAFFTEVMLVAMSLPGSLMHSDATGTDGTGYSAARVSYRERRSEEFLRAIHRGEVMRLPLRTLQEP